MHLATPRGWAAAAAALVLAGPWAGGHAQAPTAAPPAPAAAAPAQPTAAPVTFTDAQADRGRSAYVQNCVDCHGPNLDDGEFGGAPLKGNYFSEHWAVGTADALFLYTSTLMPPDRPGALSQQTYADIVAFLLRSNGYPAGAQELPADPDALAHMSLER